MRTSKLLVLAGALVMGTSAMAADVKPYVGVGVGVASVKAGATASDGVISVSASDRENDLAMALKGGVVVNDSHRISFAYQPVFIEDYTVNNIVFGYDYLIPVSNAAKFYVGAHAGIVDGDSDSDLPNAQGAAYGVQLGYIYDISKNVEFELGAMYTKYSGADSSVTVDGIDVEFELKDAVSGFVGVNYKF